ncbi:MAG: type II toxin-antitoxin system VapB family antitoxin [Acidimicrobiia bacterium]|nr:type II toxin-antitoxin system VapB family antitoxin [Acidimicrobiia bacterium]
MTKRLIDIDDQALEDARALLDGATIKDTVNTALREFSDRDTRTRLFARIQKLAADDLGNPEIMRGAHREWNL